MLTSYLLTANSVCHKLMPPFYFLFFLEVTIVHGMVSGIGSIDMKFAFSNANSDRSLVFISMQLSFP